MDNHVDLTPVIQALIGIAVAAIGTIGSWAIFKLGQWLGLKKDDQNLQLIDTVMKRAITAGAMKLPAEITAKGWDHPDVHNEIVAEGLKYVISKFPDMLAKSGFDPSTPEGQQNIEAVLWRVLPSAITEVAASPATPPVTDASKPAGA